MNYILLAFLLLFTHVIAQNQFVSPNQYANDNNALNYALNLENLIASFYNHGQQNFSIQNFNSSGYASSVFNYINLIRDHENAHVTFLTSVLQSRNASIIQNCTFNFGNSFSNISHYLSTAQLLENIAVMAYDGAANAITDVSLLTSAATIATTEARHAAFLNELNSQFAFSNNSFDTAMSPTAIIAALSVFNSSCPLGAQPSIGLPLIRSTFDTNVTNTNSTSKRSLAARQYIPPSAFQNDNDLLNFALHLEQLGSAFYNNASAKFSAANFSAAGFNASVYNHFMLIVLHETTHANFLTSLLASRNSSLIVQPCTYNLTAALSSVTSVLQTARTLENLEVTIYDGSIQSIYDAGIVQTAATIATIEARHAAYLNNLLLNEPILNQSRDSTLTPQQALNITAPYFVSCPQQVPIPQPYFLFQPYNINNNVSTSTTPSQFSSPSVSTTPSQFYSASSTNLYSLSRSPVGQGSASASSRSGAGAKTYPVCYLFTYLYSLF